MLAALAAGLAVFGGAPAASASITRAQAQAKALTAAGVKKGTEPVIVFKLSSPVTPGVRIAEGGPAGSALKRSPAVRKRRLRKAGVKTSKAAIVASVGRHGAWFFYVDKAPFKAYQHPGQVVLVDAKTGKVTKTRTLLWPPLIKGRLPAFMRTAAAYRSKKNYAFYRPDATARSAANAFLAAIPSITRTAATQQAADTLAAQHACVVRISDTLGDFYDFGNVDSTRAQIDTLFEGLEALNHGFVSERYSTSSGRTPTGFVQNLIGTKGCEQLLIYIAGAGIKGAHSTAVIGQAPHGNGSLDAQYLTSAEVARLVGANRGVEFDLLVDAPYSDGFATGLKNQPNVALVLTPSGPNTGNADGVLAFTNGLLVGVSRVLGDPAEVQAAASQTQVGFLAALLRRAFQKSTEVDLPTQSPPNPGAPPPQGSATTPPVASDQSLTTPEDTALPVTLAGTDADSDPLTFAIATQPEHGALTGTPPNVTYTPATDYNGPDGFTYTASDGQATSAPATVAITVTPVADGAADDTGSTDQNTTLSPSAPGVLSNDTDTGPGNSKTVVKLNGSATLTGTSTKGAAVTISADGSYSYNPGNLFKHLPAGVDDTDTFTYTMKDSANVETTATVTITIHGLNDAPVATADTFNGANSAVGNTVLGVSTSPPSPRKTITGSLKTNDTDPDDGAPLAATAETNPSGNGGSAAINTDGSFTYTPPVGFTGSDSFTYHVTDGTATTAGTVTVAVANRVWYVKNDFLGVPDGRSATPFTTLAAADTAAGATGDTIYVLRGTGTTGLSDTVDLLASQRLLGEAVNLQVGSDTLFTGTPANRPPLSGTINLDDGNTISGIAMTGSGAPAIAGASGDVSGTISDVTIAGASGGVSVTGTATGTFTFTNVAITTTGGTAFLVNSTGTPTINVGSGGTESVSATGGSGVDIASTIAGASSIAFDSVSASGGAFGIELASTGAVAASFGTGTISGSTAGFRVSGGSGTISYLGNLGDGTGLSADIQNRSGGSVTVSGNISDGADAGGGISMASNSGGSVTFSGSTKTLNTGAAAGFSSSGSNPTITLSNGGLAITTTSGAGFSATGGGTLTVSGTGNTISTGSGTGANIANTTISATGATFQSVASNGAASGIVLNNTGSSGGLTVTGTGTANSGGTIQNSTTNGVTLTTTHAVSLNRMNIQNSSGSGVRGTTAVDGFAFTNGTINNSGTGGGNQESSIAFNDPTGSATDAKVTGTVTITGNTLTNALWHGVSILQFAGTLDDVNISNNTITSGTTTGTGGNSFGSGIQLFADGTASAVASVTRAELNNNTITNFPGGVLMALQGGTANNSGPVGMYGQPISATNDIEVQGNILNGGGTTPDGSGGVVKPNQIILATVNGKGVGNFNIQNNGSVADPLSGSAGNVIDISAGGAVTVKAVVTKNEIDAAGQTVSGTSGIAAGVGPFTVTGPTTLSSSTLYGTVTNNTIKNSAGSGIRLNVNAGDPTLNAIVTGNNVSAPIAATYGIQVVQGNNAGFTGNTNLQISGNTSVGGAGGGNTFPGIGLRKFGTATNEFNILSLSPSPATNAQMESFVAGQNPGSASGTFGTGGVAAVNGSSSNWTSTGGIPSP